MRALAFVALSGLALLAACASTGTTSPPDTAMSISLAQAAYTGLAQVASSYEASPGADATAVKDIEAANEVAHAALSQAVTALAACPYAAGRFDATCASSAAVTGAATTLETAIAALAATLTAHGVSLTTPPK